MEPLFAWLIVLIGLGLGYAGLKHHFNFGVGYIGTIIVAAVLIVAPFSMGWISTDDITGWLGTDDTAAVVGMTTWDITASTDNGVSWDFNGVLADDDDDKTVTVPVTIISGHEGTGGRAEAGDCRFAVNFTLKPIPPSGSTTEDLVTIYYKTDYNMKYGGEDLLNETGSYYDAEIYDDGAQTVNYYESQQSMDFTDTGWANFTYELDNTSSNSALDEFEAVGDSLVWHITFWTDEGWSEVWTVTMIVIAWS